MDFRPPLPEPSEATACTSETCSIGGRAIDNVSIAPATCATSSGCATTSNELRGRGSMLSNVGKLSSLIFLLARIGVISAHSVADTYESATVSVTSSTAGQYHVAPT